MLELSAVVLMLGCIVALCGFVSLGFGYVLILLLLFVLFVCPKLLFGFGPWI